jgi:putative membrane protein
MTRREAPLVVVNAVYISVFTTLALRRDNYEFLLYSCVVLAAAVFVLFLHRTYRFSSGELWGLTLWGLLHMAGGNVRVGEGVLYEVQLLPGVLRFDQFVHAFGFGVSTLVCFRVLSHFLRPNVDRWWPLAVLTLLMGSGLGAMNEIVEFVAVLTMPETGVGGYDNTMWDLVFNLIGGVVAVGWLTAQRRARMRG